MAIDQNFKPETPLVYTASIVEVNTEDYTMRVFSKQKGVTMPIEIPSLFTNVRKSGSGGMHILPEVGSEVWVCETSDGTVIPLQYHNVVGAEGYASGRPSGLEGDIVLSTSSGNCLKILKGGSVLTQASPTCSTLHDGYTDTKSVFCSQLKQYSLASKIEHTINYANRYTKTLYNYFDSAESTEPCVSVEAGKVSAGSVYSFKVGNAVTVSMSKLGLTDITINNILNLTVTGNTTVTSPLVTFTGGIVAATVAVGGAGAPPALSADEFGVTAGDPDSENSHNLVKTGDINGGFFYDLSGSLNGLIATVTALQVIVETLDKTFTAGQIQSTLSTQNLDIDATPLILMKAELDSYLNSIGSSYATTKLRSE